jgi:hypothetical protein
MTRLRYRFRPPERLRTAAKRAVPASAWRQPLGPMGPVRTYAVLRNGWRAIYDDKRGGSPPRYRELRVLAGRVTVSVRRVQK